MDTLHFSLRLLALSQVLLLFLSLLIHQRHSVGLLTALVLLSFGCYLMAPFSGLQYPGHQLVLLISTAAPSFLWLLARIFFIDDKYIPAWFWLISAIYILMSVLLRQDPLSTQDAALTVETFALFPQLIKLGLVFHVFYMAIEGRANDLVSQRLKIRVPIAVGGSALTTLIILVEISSQGAVPMVIEVIGSALMLAVCLGCNVYLLKLREDMPLTLSTTINPKAKQTPTPLPADDQGIQRIDSAMKDDRFYANHGATISDLSKHLSIVEHRLRPMINREMGFRNFNQFLNAYRIDEASNRLITESKLPIITIALDVGFKSLSSFNKAFKDKHHQTPTEFRLNAKID